MKQKALHYLQCLLPAAKKWWKDKHADDAAALAFYSLISLVPLLFVSIYLASMVVDEETAKRILISETDRVAGKSIGKYIATILHNDIKWTGSSLSPIIGGLLILFSATKMVSELRNSLGKVFGRSKKPKKVYAGVISRLVSISIVLTLGGVIVSAVAVETILNLLMKNLPDQSILLRIASGLTPITSIVGVIILATLTMRWLPERRPKLKEACAGGVICALLLVILKVAITQTLKHTDIGGYYGSAFTLVLVLFWVYFTMQVFLYGAEYAAELTRRQRLINEQKDEGPDDNKSKSDPKLEPKEKVKDEDKDKDPKQEPKKEVPQKRDPFLS